MKFKVQVFVEPKDEKRCGNCQFLSIESDINEGAFGHCTLFDNYVEHDWKNDEWLRSDDCVAAEGKGSS